jgi:hypothetical protein
MKCKHEPSLDRRREIGPGPKILPVPKVPRVPRVPKILQVPGVPRVLLVPKVGYAYNSSILKILRTQYTPSTPNTPGTRSTPNSLLPHNPLYTMHEFTTIYSPFHQQAGTFRDFRDTRLFPFHQNSNDDRTRSSSLPGGQDFPQPMHNREPL